MESIISFVRSQFCDVCGIQPEMINESTNLVEDLSIDSIDFMDVIYEIDRQYDIRLPIEDWNNAIRSGSSSSDEFFRLDNFAAQIGMRQTGVSDS